MRFLVAIALLVLAVADAHHTREHTLRGPRFSVGKLHVYDVELNATAGIWGLSNQVSKSAFKAELQVYAKNEKEYYLKLVKVYTSGSVNAVNGIDENIPLQKNRDLEDRLSTPIKFTLENGEVTSYTLSSKESLESRKIKKSILRSLEMYIPESAHQQLESSSRLKIPVFYNFTWDTSPSEKHTTYYLITVSPNVEYPYHNDVYNISRSENFEEERYPSHKFHHNFDYQGCSDVCNQSNTNKTNLYEAGCPVGYEPHQSPMKTYVHHQHHLTLEDGVMTPEIIETVETHVAKMYDQDMSIVIQTSLRKIGYRKKSMEEPSGRTYTDLNNQELEINTPEIEEQCGYKSSREATAAARQLFGEIAQTIARGDLGSPHSQTLGEKLILLKNALSKLSVSELQTVAGDMKRSGSLPSASDEEKIKRQVWMDMLPVIGTESAVTYIINYIKDNVGRELLVWEAKEILEALPQNIHMPSEKTIREFRVLLDLPNVKSRHLLHSAAHMSFARIISAICNGTQEENSNWSPRGPSSRSQRQASSSSSPYDCPEGLVSEIVKQISTNLRNTKRRDETITYIDTLATIGTPEVLPVLSEYVYGTAENMQDYSPSYHEFVRTAAVFSLHRMTQTYPESVLDNVVPLFFNESEIPKLRNAAFGVLIRSQPSLEILQHVADLSYHEKSDEVHSFVSSTMETHGNSTLPCMALTTQRIQQVMPMMNMYNGGIQHAKNHLWTYFDDLKQFGLKAQLSYIPSNESIIPSGIYQALSYSTDSLTDSLIQNALHIQGLTQRKVIEFFDTHVLGIPPPEAISPSKEQEIFEQAKIADHIPDSWKLTIYRKMFYSSSFYYLDVQNVKSQVDILRDYLRAYLVRTSYDYSGHLVKVYLPSTFHTETVARTLPYPVEFQMLHPVVFALKIESKERNPTPAKFHFAIRPSVYLSKLYIHQLKNLGDCKEIGVYHENKIAVSYPFEVKAQVHGLLNVTISYKIPELPKRILHYFTESGSYVGQKSFDKLPSSQNREPMRTLPSPFEHTPQLTFVGLPPIQISLHSEDITLFSKDAPRTLQEALDMAVERIQNAGWRYAAANVTLKDDSRVWPRDTEVTMNLEYNRTHVSKRNLKIAPRQASPWFQSPEDYSTTTTEEPESDYTEPSQWISQDSPQTWSWRKDSRADAAKEDWSRNLLPRDYSRCKASAFIDQARSVNGRLSANSHMIHELDLEIKTRPLKSHAHFTMLYNHTHDKSLHAFYLNASLKFPQDHTPKKISLAHVMEFFGKPDEFRYDSHNDEHRASFITALQYHPEGKSNKWQDADIVSAGVFYYESLENVLNDELQNRIDSKFFWADLHEECNQDVQNGHPLSVNCIKAIRERSIYNRLKIATLWNKNLPDAVKNGFRRLDNFYKHVFYDQTSITYENNIENMIFMNLTYINKLTDIPVTDVTIRKPYETLNSRRVETLGHALDDPVSSIYGILGVDTMVLTNNSYPPTCVMMKKYVRTYDLKSYPVSLDQCNYVLSAHCTDYKNFAIIAKVLSPSDSTKEIHIHVGAHTIILTPKNGKDYTINYDGQQHVVSDTLVFDEDTADIYVFTERFPSSHHLQVVASKAGIRVIYDGQNVKVQVDPRYKGELCGLCSEFDGERVREYRGLDRCLYSHPDDFVNSAITNREKCRKQPVYPYDCENQDSSNMVWRRGGDSDDEYVPTTKRNIAIQRGNEICFSLRPVPVCEENSHPTKTETVMIGFHCLPKQDVTAKRMVSEAKRRSLGEIENKSVDFTENIEVPKMCSK